MAERLTIVDKFTGEVVPVTRFKDKWWIRSGGKSKYRYFTREQIEKALLRKRLEAMPKKELDRRNNVESAMFQISYHTRNNKTRYRGLVKHVMWACARCMWINFIRLVVFQATACQRTLFALLWAIWRPQQGHLSQVRESLLNLLYIFVGGQQRRLEPQIILAG